MGRLLTGLLQGLIEGPLPLFQQIGRAACQLFIQTDVEERALPFQVGHEVFVTIEEPHMYNEDDAVAKIDGYIVSVTGAGRLIGEQRLVRIERIGRTAADASLVGEGPAGGSPEPRDETEEDRSARRRRRRGGRSRSHADAVAEGAD